MTHNKDSLTTSLIEFLTILDHDSTTNQAHYFIQSQFLPTIFYWRLCKCYFLYFMDFENLHPILI